MNKHVLVVNNIATPLRKINESAANGKSSSSPMIMSGTFTELDVLNRNGRIYTPDNFLPLVAEMQDRIANGAVYGEMDHPDVFDITFQKTSHIIEKIEYNKEKNIVEGQIRLLSTYWGREAQAIVNDGCPIFVSSRAAGITDSNGYVTLKKLFTYDIVADPGFATAKMNPACLNEALGINENANYAIFELNTENQIQSLYNMNNDDKKTHSQLAEYSAYVDEQIASLKEEISRLTKSSNNEQSILEKAGELESLKQQNEVLERYLNKLSTKVVSLISKVNDLSSTNEALKEEIQIVGKFAEHVAEHTNEAKKDIEIVGKFAEHVAEHTNEAKKDIEIVGKFAEHVAEHTNEAKKDIEIVGKFAEHVAEHTNEAKKDIEVVGKFAEHVAEHTKSNLDTAKYIKERLEQTVLFAEHIAQESVKTFDEQTRFIEYVAENTHENKVYETYLKNKLEALINYNIDTAAKLNEAFSNGVINENVITVESPESYLKDEELPEGTEDVEVDDTDTPTDDLTIGELESPESTEESEESEESTEKTDSEESTEESTDEPVVTYGDGLVRITGTDLTGIVVSYDEDGVTIKLSDSNEEVTKPHGEVEKLEEVEDDSTLLESVMNLISEVNLQYQCHFLQKFQ